MAGSKAAILSEQRAYKSVMSVRDDEKLRKGKGAARSLTSVTSATCSANLKARHVYAGYYTMSCIRDGYLAMSPLSHCNAMPLSAP